MIHATVAHRLVTDPVARAMLVLDEHINIVLYSPHYDEPMLTNIEHTTWLPPQYRDAFILELRRAGYTVEKLTETEDVLIMSVDWSKPKVFNTQMEV